MVSTIKKGFSLRGFGRGWTRRIRGQAGFVFMFFEFAEILNDDGLPPEYIEHMEQMRIDLDFERVLLEEYNEVLKLEGEQVIRISWLEHLMNDYFKQMGFSPLHECPRINMRHFTTIDNRPYEPLEQDFQEFQEFRYTHWYSASPFEKSPYGERYVYSRPNMKFSEIEDAADVPFYHPEIDSLSPIKRSILLLIGDNRGLIKDNRGLNKEEDSDPPFMLIVLCLLIIAGVIQETNRVFSNAQEITFRFTC